MAAGAKASGSPGSASKARTDVAARSAVSWSGRSTRTSSRARLAEAGLKGVFVGPGKLARERSRRDAEVSRLPKGVAPLLGEGAGLTGKARRGKSLAAWVSTRSGGRDGQAKR